MRRGILAVITAVAFMCAGCGTMEQYGQHGNGQTPVPAPPPADIGREDPQDGDRPVPAETQEPVSVHRDYIGEHEEKTVEKLTYSDYEGKKLKKLLDAGYIAVAANIAGGEDPKLIVGSASSGSLFAVTLHDPERVKKAVRNHKNDIKAAAKELSGLKIREISDVSDGPK